MEMTHNGKTLLKGIQKQLKENSNKLSFDFIEEQANSAVTTYVEQRGITFCTLTLCTGHKVTGEAMVLDYKNNDPEIGRKVAFENARDKLWSTFGLLAILYIGE